MQNKQLCGQNTDKELEDGGVCATFLFEAHVAHYRMNKPLKIC